MEPTHIIILLFMMSAQFSSAFVTRSSKTLSGKNNVAIGHESNHQEKKSFLWRIEANPPSFLFGTIHVPFTKVWDSIPENVMEAFNSSHKLYLELDMNKETISALLSCSKLPNNQTLSTFLPPNLYLKWKNYLGYLYQKIDSWITPVQRLKGLSAGTIFEWVFGHWEKRRPLWTLIKTQMVIENIITSIEYPQLDSYLALLGKLQGKFVSGIEYVDECCSTLNNLNNSQVLFIVQKFLEADQDVLLELSTKSLHQLTQVYRRGTLSPSYFLKSFGIFPRLSKRTNLINNESIWLVDSDEDIQMAQEIDSYLKSAVVFKRNEIMGKRVTNLVRNNPETSFFFAFGVGHFIGENSVVDILRQTGMKIERVSPFTKILNQQQFIRPKATQETISVRTSYPEENCSCDQLQSFNWLVCAVRCALGF